MKNYFAGLTTAAEINSVYRVLRVALHPDNGGNTAAFQELTSQHAAALATLEKSTATTADGSPLEIPAAVIGLPEKSDSSSLSAVLLDLIEKASQLPGVSVELCGSWLWVTGDTKPVKAQVKALGFRFSGNKKAWYWHDPKEGYRRHGKRRYDMDEIREMHGSQKLA